MFAWLISAVVPSLADSVIKALFAAVTAEIDRRNLIVQGMQQQAAKETAATAKTEETVAQALADAPHSRDETLAALDKGAF